MSESDDRAPRGPRPRVRVGTWPWPLPAGGTAAPASSISPSSFFEHWLETFRAAYLTEAGAGGLFPWVPVAFGSGIALYFAAAHEPFVSVTVPLALMLCVIAVLARRTRAFVSLVLIASVAAGFAAATVRTARISHGVLARTVLSATVTGFVETHEERDRSDRFVLRVESIDAPRVATIEPGASIERVRLSVKKGTAPDVGNHVTLKARLLPPLAPLRPGGYDFSRDLYFQQIGASGFVQGAIKVTPGAKPPSIWLRYQATLQGIRDVIDDRIRMAMHGGDTRAIASALLTGRHDAITTPVNDAMFISGLGHVLSISGYHMAVVAGVVFFTVRALLALIPMFAGRPVKKWAAAVALVAAFFYLLLSGAEVATQRSFIMIAVVLVAVMVDRRAVTFRTLALAALAVLVFLPEALVHPSFQS